MKMECKNNFKKLDNTLLNLGEEITGLIKDLTNQM